MITIVGGSGFIGTRLAGLFDGSHIPFKIVDIRKSSVFPQQFAFADVRSLDSLMDALPDGTDLIHLAAVHRDDVRPLSLYDEVNVSGAKNLCEAARKKGVQRIVFTSSVAVYGFAPIGTDEAGAIRPFNDYGRTKAEAEQVFKAWQAEDPARRSLVIVRPTVVFGEQNRGNVYNLLKQMAAGRFVMVGNGKNRKSMAYVGNVAAFLAYSLSLPPGVRVFNYIDKPDFTMNDLVDLVRRLMGKDEKIGIRLPYAAGFSIGKLFDFATLVTGKRFAVSSIRVKKFCANSVYGTAVENTDFVPPVQLSDALAKTVKFEFLEKNGSADIFYSE